MAIQQYDRNSGIISTCGLRKPGYVVLTCVIACSSTSKASWVTRSVSMATVRVASTSRSKSSARSAYRPNQYRSFSTRGTMAIEADTAGTKPGSSPADRAPRSVGRQLARYHHPDVLGQLAAGSVTNTPRRSDMSSVTRARPPNIAVYDPPLRTAKERSTTLRRTSRSCWLVGAEDRCSTS